MSTELKYLGGTSRPYAASYIIFKRDDTVAFVLRSQTGWMDGNFGLPAGRVDEGESPSQAAIREAKEEVDAVINVSNLNAVLTLHRYSTSDDTIWVDTYFEATEWEGELINAEPHKHGELSWFPLSTLPDNLVPSVRFALQQIIDGKTYAEFGWNASELE